tara:strand:- start:11759 stop:12841 length:1083 start_codon:yes stop_codon:yes gene_type:complete
MYFITLFFLGIGMCFCKNERFENWISDFKIEIKDGDHYNHLLKNWIENDKYIELVNNQNNTYVLGHNVYSGMDENEFASYFSLGAHKKINYDKIKKDIKEIKCIVECSKENKDNKIQLFKCVKSCFDTENMLQLSEYVNWVEKGAVTDVKNQGQCGSCWSFSTTGALEGAYYIKYGELDSFSEQQLVDCDTRKNGGKDMGCNGGLMDNAFSWIEKNDGLCLEKDYAYVSGNTKKSGTCDTSCTTVSGSQIKSFVDVEQSSDTSMMQAISLQPVSVAIQADQKDFQLYKSGVFTGTCGKKLDHGVLLVGYGSEDGEDYYLIKNSWGESWGDKGYIKLGKGDEYNNGDGQCGVLLQGSYPVL